MTGSDVSDGDMPNFPWPGRRDVSAIGDMALAALLAGGQVPEDSAGLQAAADVVAALRAGPASDELAGEATALAEFRDRVGVSHPARRSPRRRPALLTSLLSAKVAAAVAAAAICIGGVATAAYAGALPGPVQRLAHDAIGAPTARQGMHPARLAAGAAARRPAAHWLCIAYARAKAHGTAAQQAVAYHNLVKAAGGADKVVAYCAPPRHQPFRHRRHTGCRPAQYPSRTPGSHPSRTLPARPASPPACTPGPRPTWKPGPRPSRPHHTGRPAPHPSGKPAPYPSGKPAPYPSATPTSRP